MENNNIPQPSPEVDAQFLQELTAALGERQLEIFPPELPIAPVEIPDMTRWLDNE